MVKIKTEWCKKCGICCVICPKGVFQLEDYKILIDNKKCIQCSRCELYCPDFAISLSNQK